MTAVTLLAENELPMDPVWFGVLAFVILMVMLAITLGFRGISHRNK